MKLSRILPGIIVILSVYSCATKKLVQEGNAAYQAGNYASALASLEQVIEKRESMGGKAAAKIYYKAGMAALELEKQAKGREYLETASNLEYSSPELYASLAKIYRNIDNLSKEITALENYYKKFPEGERIDTITTRLFETYVESENWEPAYNLWPKIDSDAQSDTGLLTGYLIVNKNLENDDACDELANRILKMDPDNIPALEWNAFKYFWQAENRYLKEMKAYEENRTRSQYNKLLKAWDIMFANYRKARDLLKKLYYTKPDPEYARYLETIYIRMDEDDKAAFWRAKIK